MIDKSRTLILSLHVLGITTTTVVVPGNPHRILAGTQDSFQPVPT
jgi:hypothetical protein